MKVCLITGVTREEGLGFAIARRMHEIGFQVCLGGRHLANVRTLAAKIDPAYISVTALPLDVVQEESVAACVAAVSNSFGQIDVLINNAATGFDSGVQPADAVPAALEAILNTNLLGAWRMIVAALPLLRRSRAPRIVNVSSAAGSFSDPVYGIGRHPAIVPGYSISKLALNGLTVQFGRQLSAEGILINSVDPGFVATYPGLKEKGGRPPLEAAEGIVWAATLPDNGPTGRFFRDGKEIAW
jgi:NAD(P)-dependent dehydrogenase (short-subunit alcohol dehydrogenase family)